MTVEHKPEQAAVRGLLQAVRDTLGHDVAPEWRKAAQAVPRHLFLPTSRATCRSPSSRSDPTDSLGFVRGGRAGRGA
ncbi:hypothetical protein P3T39_000913 [Kitasatospora sp. GP82]|nr:hypothetical protein [Kitasatospora sp. GP82]